MKETLSIRSWFVDPTEIDSDINKNFLWRTEDYLEDGDEIPKVNWMESKNNFVERNSSTTQIFISKLWQTFSLFDRITKDISDDLLLKSI